MKNNEKTTKLAQLFAEYEIYPRSCFNGNSPARVFQNFYPRNHYSEELKDFLSYQNYPSTKRGVDLPWWGKDYFNSKSGKKRVMVISQDSKAKDAGSIVFFAHLMPVVSSEADYKRYTQAIKRPFSYKIWKTIKELFTTQWDINLNHLYITDGKKVYKEGSRWKEGKKDEKDFDTKKSKELLEREIDLCNPNLIIILGGYSLSLLDKSRKYDFTVEDGKIIDIRGKKCVVAPFPTGRWMRSHPAEFKNRLRIATHLIKSIIH